MVASWSSNSLKILLFFTGVISIAVTSTSVVPIILNFAVNKLPAICSVIDSWLEPPYVYIIANGLIIAIIAFTHFQPNHFQDNYYYYHAPPPPDLTSDLPPVPIHLSSGATEPPRGIYDIKHDVIPDVVETVVDGEEDEDEFMSTRSTWSPLQDRVKKVKPEFNFPVKVKPLVTSRFARKPLRKYPEGVRPPRVLKPNKHETLDSTWKMITDGHCMPSTKQFRKSDTLVKLNDNHTPMVKKSETFKDRTAFENQNHQPRSPEMGGRLKKDLTPSHVELNRRVEAFIKKFNNDMRLQREESIKQYMEMINRGAD